MYKPTGSAVFKSDFSLVAGQPPTPIPGSFDFIYCRSASLDVLQVTADGSTWSDLPVGMKVPIYGLNGPRIPLLRAKGGLAVSAVIFVSIGDVQDFSTIIASGTQLNVQGVGSNGVAISTAGNPVAVGGSDGANFRTMLVAADGIQATREGSVNAYRAREWCNNQIATAGANVMCLSATGSRGLLLKRIWTDEAPTGPAGNNVKFHLRSFTGVPSAFFVVGTAHKRNQSAPASQAAVYYNNTGGSGMTVPALAANEFAVWGWPTAPSVSLSHEKIYDLDFTKGSSLGIFISPGQSLQMMLLSAGGAYTVTPNWEWEEIQG